MATDIVDSSYLTNAYWQSNVNSSQLGTYLQKLSSSYGINYTTNQAGAITTGRDLDIELLQIELNALTKTQNDVDETASLLQTAENNLDEIYSKLLTLKELATESATVANADERAVNQAEANALVYEIDNIAKNTQYNGQYLINGDLAEGIKTGIRDQTGNELTIELQSARTDALGMTSGTTSLNEILNEGIGDMSTVEGANNALDIIENAIQDVLGMKGAINAYQSFLSNASSNITTTMENATAAQSAIGNVGEAYQTTSYTKNLILMDAGTAILAQANISPMSVLSLLG